MKLIIGLGNPGLEYNKTRHNLGFFVLEQFLSKKGLKLDKEKFDSVYTTDGVGDDKVIYAEPTTFMNLSGLSVGEISKFYKINPKDILVIYDDLDLPVGQPRFRSKGSAGGHNGIKSIIKHLGTEDFNRLRIGIGKNNIEASKYVLGKFSKQDQEEIEKKMNDYFNIIEEFLNK